MSLSDVCFEISTELENNGQIAVDLTWLKNELAWVEKDTEQYPPELLTLIREAISNFEASGMPGDRFLVVLDAVRIFYDSIEPKSFEALLAEIKQIME